MKIKIKDPGSLPRNWKEVGLSSKAWEDLNGGKAIEVESIPSRYKNLVEEVESSPASTGSKAPIKGGKK
jgi:hypothetical protein